MAEHILKTYTCDRCGVGLGNEKPKSDCSIKASFTGEFAPEAIVNWTDLCRTCRKVSLEFFQGLRS